MCGRPVPLATGWPLMQKDTNVIKQAEQTVALTSRFFNWVAAGSVAAMMLLTCADVVLRYLRRPIPGTYEMVGLLGAVFVSFALAQTSIEKGHIAVDFLVQRLSPKTQTVVEAVNALICTGLFAIISWQSCMYAGKLRQLGEVSMTLQMPIHPFVYGISIGCGLLTLVLGIRFATVVSSLATERKV